MPKIIIADCPEETEGRRSVAERLSNLRSMKPESGTGIAFTAIATAALGGLIGAGFNKLFGKRSGVAMSEEIANWATISGGMSIASDFAKNRTIDGIKQELDARHGGEQSR